MLVTGDKAAVPLLGLVAGLTAGFFEELGSRTAGVTERWPSREQHYGRRGITRRSESTTADSS
jgi:hypothetical protein